jgi:NAD(P)-dependent dehydrogenase (short-subunit alcohol dehydrogenase family)
MHMLHISLENMVVIITGAAAGIGRAIALKMAEAGASAIVIADTNEQGAYETAALLQAFQTEGFVVPTNVADQRQTDQLVERTLEKFGKIDILVNNAGVHTDENFLDITEARLRHVVDTNFSGHVLLAARVAREMIKRQTKGSILYTLSIHWFYPQMHLAYSCSKAAIAMAVRESALELAAYGIRVNGVAPGAINLTGEKDKPAPHIPLGYIGNPEDIANYMTFLASPLARYQTGEVITVDGAFSLVSHYWWWKHQNTL